ncbi:serine hydrolase domain-containing protein [Paenibacillus sp.]|jgi:CubicO group peptidase (beta-lactamase class C family)|uniref:serine hydrolase domain-containing protein n=1 Tax=Paenibacillus sp. TaxID=58172 RepID=UPI00282B701A|nr:serine hydrolase domain-containing protein [Paenibacillus sp.]MDR0269563.1 beta-lactamase family protein [Paenibacillus sp.]
MKKILSKTGTSTVCVILLIVIITTIVCWDELGSLVRTGDYSNTDNMVKTIMSKSATPGVAVVLLKQGKTEYKSYGYADVKNKKRVTEESLFELGSTTKAFTALAVILLENEGHLSQSDSITNYIPSFEPTIKGEKVNITINQLLAHTSGIPPWSIRLIPEGTTEDMLEKTIHNVSDIALDTYPGTAYNYATVNYDVLAMIIEKVTGKRYQDYITENILVPLGMTDSYFSTGQEKESDKLTKGYRVLFGKDLEYNAPRYYGNIAAGYLVTNSKDLERWINAQMGISDIPDNLLNAIQQSHQVDIKTAGYEEDNQYYSFGWSIDTKNRVVRHSGANPNYSSQVIINLEKQQAIFVLANMNSTAPSLIANNIYENMNDSPMNKFNYDDVYVLIDLIFSFLVIVAVANICLKAIKLVRGIKLNIKDEKTRFRKLIGSSVRLILSIMFLALVFIWPYLFNNSYYMIRVWMSYSIFIWMGLAAINCILSMIINIKKIVIIRGSL